MKVFAWDEINGAKDEEKRLEVFFSGTSDMYAILQLKLTEETRPMAFVSYADLQRRGEQPDPDHYEMIYTAPLLPYKNQETMLEELYEKFNIAHPEDFHGHSLSVSDIVVLRTAGQISCHYVDSIGFQTLPEFLKPENYLKYAEMSMEDDYGMIDGVINNGKKEPAQGPQEKESILEKLHAAKEPPYMAQTTPKERDRE